MDVICIGEPKSWYEWINFDPVIPLLATYERFKETKINTCGDFYRHPILKGRKPLNCGVIGHRAGFDFSDRFFEITKNVRYGETHDSLFITEQGAINLWIYSLELEGIPHHVLNFKTNAQFRDFVYYLTNNVNVETVHAVSWHKRIIKRLKNVMEQK